MNASCWITALHLVYYWTHGTFTCPDLLSAHPWGSTPTAEPGQAATASPRTSHTKANKNKPPKGEFLETGIQSSPAFSPGSFTDNYSGPQRAQLHADRHEQTTPALCFCRAQSPSAIPELPPCMMQAGQLLETVIASVWKRHSWCNTKPVKRF